MRIGPVPVHDHKFLLLPAFTANAIFAVKLASSPRDHLRNPRRDLMSRRPQIFALESEVPRVDRRLERRLKIAILASAPSNRRKSNPPRALRRTGERAQRIPLAFLISAAPA